jgi:hypothetical protein
VDNEHVHSRKRHRVLIDDGKLPDLLLRWHKGATLTPTAKDLVFTTDMHPQAQSHWMDASYKKNGDKWARVAEKAVISSLG